jgi:hypothetical protein
MTPVDMAQPVNCGATADPCVNDSDCCSGTCLFGIICQ